MFLWHEAVGGAWALERRSTRRPDAPVTFEEHHVAGVCVLVDATIAFEHIRVERRRWPFRGVEILVDGEPFGRRGPATNGGGGDGGNGF